MEPVGRPVRRHVCSVAPDAPDLVAAEGLPDILAGPDILRGHDHAAVRGQHAPGNRGRLTIDLDAEVDQDGEGSEDDGRQATRQLLVSQRSDVLSFPSPGK
mgnify:CR=1 FL=1